MFIVEIYRKNELPPCSGSGKERKKEREEKYGKEEAVFVNLKGNLGVELCLG